MYEGGIRVAGLARWPGQIKPGSTSAVPVIGSDLMPTALAAAGVATPAKRVLDGVNILPVLTGKAQALERTQPLYWRLNLAPNNLHIALREGDWKILAAQDGSKYELYNLKTDPKESQDLKNVETERFERMKATLLAQTKAIEAEGPDWWKKLSPNGGRLPKNK
jgi:arylsulfatase A-like enzyme